MCPLRLVPRLFLFDEEELMPELRAQRTLNRGRIPEIARYITENSTDYVFSALTASVDADMHFEAFEPDGPRERIGLLAIPMSARFVINDGQHRRAAIEQALRDKPELGDESIAVVLFLDVGLDRCQQMFADLNRYAIRTDRSLGVLYDHREETAQIVRRVVFDLPLFRGLVDLEKSNLSPRSRKLFTLSGLHTATKELLDGFGDLPLIQRIELARSYWEQIARQFPEWQQVYEGNVSAGEVRRDFIHSHGIILHALGKVGHNILRNSLNPEDWTSDLQKLRAVNWSRSNASLWEGRAIIGGKVSKASANVLLTTITIRIALGQPLSPEELTAEGAFHRGDS